MSWVFRCWAFSFREFDPLPFRWSSLFSPIILRSDILHWFRKQVALERSALPEKEWVIVMVNIIRSSVCLAECLGKRYEMCWFLADRGMYLDLLFTDMNQYRPVYAPKDFLDVLAGIRNLNAVDSDNHRWKTALPVLTCFSWVLDQSCRLADSRQSCASPFWSIFLKFSWAAFTRSVNILQ